MKKSVFKKLFLLCSAVYFVSHLTRMNYAASLTEIIKDMALTKKTASLAVTGSFIMLWIGQMVAGLLGDRVKPRRLVTMGLTATTVINLTMAFMRDITVMTVLWSLNGFFQAFLWPPMTKVMAENLNSKEYARVALAVSLAGSSSSIAVYLLTPLAISAAGWRYVFVFAAAFGLIMAITWGIGTIGVKENTKPTAVPTAADGTKPTGSGVKQMILLSGLIPICGAVIVQGAMKDGIATWMPTYIFDTYQLSSSLSILSSAMLPLFGVIGISVAAVLYHKIGDLMTTSAVLYGVAFLAVSIMLPFSSSGMVICTALTAIVSGCVYGVGHLLTAQLPHRFSKYGKVSTVSGVTSAAVYAGSSLSTYAFAALSENFGWCVTIASWAALALIGGVVCLCCIKKWKKFVFDNR